MFKVQSSKFKVGFLLLLCVAILLPLFAACEQTKQLGARVQTALTATDALIAVLPEGTPGRADYVRLRVSLAAFQVAIPKAQTPEQKIVLLVQFAALTADFSAIAKPVLPAGSSGALALAKLDVTLKGLARKLSCLLAYNPSEQHLSPEQAATLGRVRLDLEAFAE